VEEASENDCSLSLAYKFFDVTGTSIPEHFRVRFVL
jgi:hypothetical protein